MIRDTTEAHLGEISFVVGRGTSDFWAIVLLMFVVIIPLLHVNAIGPRTRPSISAQLLGVTLTGSMAFVAGIITFRSFTWTEHVRQWFFTLISRFSGVDLNATLMESSYFRMGLDPVNLALQLAIFTFMLLLATVFYYRLAFMSGWLAFFPFAFVMYDYCPLFPSLFVELPGRANYC